MAKQPRRKASISDQVYDSLKTDIFEFRLLPGDKFSEGDIATEGALQDARAGHGTIA